MSKSIGLSYTESIKEIRSLVSLYTRPELWGIGWSGFVQIDGRKFRGIHWLNMQASGGRRSEYFIYNKVKQNAIARISPHRIGERVEGEAPEMGYRLFYRPKTIYRYALEQYNGQRGIEVYRTRRLNGYTSNLRNVMVQRPTSFTLDSAMQQYRRRDAVDQTQLEHPPDNNTVYDVAPGGVWGMGISSSFSSITPDQIGQLQRYRTVRVTAPPLEDWDNDPSLPMETPF